MEDLCWNSWLACWNFWTCFYPPFTVWIISCVGVCFQTYISPILILEPEASFSSWRQQIRTTDQQGQTVGGLLVAKEVWLQFCCRQICFKESLFLAGSFTVYCSLIWLLDTQKLSEMCQRTEKDLETVPQSAKNGARRWGCKGHRGGDLPSRSFRERLRFVLAIGLCQELLRWTKLLLSFSCKKLEKRESKTVSGWKLKWLEFTISRLLFQLCRTVT